MRASARAMIGDLDPATLALADANGVSVAAALEEFGCSQPIASAEILADRVAILANGRLLACDRPEALKLAASCDTLEQAFLRIAGHAHASAGGAYEAMPAPGSGGQA